MSNVVKLEQPTEAEFERLLQWAKGYLDQVEEGIRLDRRTIRSIEDMEMEGRRGQAMKLLKEFVRNLM